MVRYAVANTPYFCTLFNSHSLSLNLQSQQQSNIHQRTPQKEMPNIILFTECGYTQHDKTGSFILWLTLTDLKLIDNLMMIC